MNNLLDSYTALLEETESIREEVHSQQYGIVLEIKRLRESLGGIDDLSENKIQQTKSSLAAQIGKMKSLHRSYYSKISGLGKEIENNMAVDVSKIANKSLLDNKLDYLNAMIIEQLYLDGNIDIATTLARELDIAPSNETQLAYEELRAYLNCIDSNNIDAVISWCQKNSMDSGIITDLFQLKVMNTISKKSAKDAIQLLRTKVGAKSAKNEAPVINRALVQTMRYFLFEDLSKQDNHVPDLSGASNNQEALSTQEALKKAKMRDVVLKGEAQFRELIRSRFVESFCAKKGISSKGFLSQAILVGYNTLPILKNHPLCTDTHSSLWNGIEFPIELDLKDNEICHSIFVCPVSHEVSAHNEPPQALVCGHLISRACLDGLVTIFNPSLQTSQRNLESMVKCPYCPTRSRIKDLRPVYF